MDSSGLARLPYNHALQMTPLRGATELCRYAADLALEQLKVIADIAQSVLLGLAMLIGGAWALFRLGGIGVRVEFPRRSSYPPDDH